jgi:ribonuclease-3
MVGRKLRKTSPEPLGFEHYGEIEEWLGYKFLDLAALERALTHRSALAHGKVDYEQLEFLGDAVLDLAVAHLLLKRHPESREGELSKMRAALVSSASLAEVAREFRLGRFVRLSWSELANGGAERASILADVLEAVLGAVYQESGFESARLCIERILSARVDHINVRDPKTDLQEALHAAGTPAPVYRLECVEGPEHAPTFISVVEVEGEVVGRGRGPTKKASHQAAAAEALLNLAAVSEVRQSQADVVEVGDAIPSSEFMPILDSSVGTEEICSGVGDGDCSAVVSGEHERDN